MRHLIRPTRTLPFALACTLQAVWGSAVAAQTPGSVATANVATGSATAASAPAANLTADAPKTPAEPAPAAPNKTAAPQAGPPAASGVKLVAVPAADNQGKSTVAPVSEGGAETAAAGTAAPSPATPVAPTTPAPAAKVVVPAKPLPPAEPLAAYFDVGVLVQTQWNKNRAYDFFSDDDLSTKGGLAIGADIVDFQPAILALDLNALFTETTTDGPLTNYISHGRLKETNLGAGVTLRYPVWSWFAPQVRVGGGVALQTGVLSGVDFGELRKDFTTGYLMLGGGFAFTIPPHRLSRTRTYLNSLGLRLLIEAGYHLGQDLEFAVEAQAANGDERPNAIAETRLGALPQSGAYLRGALQARF